VLFVMRAEEGDGRFGVTASRRIGGAVERARAKRRLRELYRLSRSHLADAAYDVVANARKSCVKAPWGELQREFSRCLARGIARVEKRAAGP
jgi:ribonuclease P protein component